MGLLTLERFLWVGGSIALLVGLFFTLRLPREGKHWNEILKKARECSEEGKSEEAIKALSLALERNERFLRYYFRADLSLTLFALLQGVQGAIRGNRIVTGIFSLLAFCLTIISIWVWREKKEIPLRKTELDFLLGLMQLHRKLPPPLFLPEEPQD